MVDDGNVEIGENRELQDHLTLCATLKDAFTIATQVYAGTGNNQQFKRHSISSKKAGAKLQGILLEWWSM